VTDVRALLEETGALLTGHFELSSGRHSDVYVQKQRVFEHPEATSAIGEAMAEQWRPAGPTVVVAPAVGAITLGFATARALGVRFLFTERADGRMHLRRGQALDPSDQVLVVEDVVTTGGSAAEVVEAVRATGARVIGVAAMVDRSNAPSSLTFTALLAIDADDWDPADCPLCRDARPLESPGSRHLSGT